MNTVLLYSWSLTLLVVGLVMAIFGLLLEDRWQQHPARKAGAKGVALLGELLFPIAIVSLIYEAHLRGVFLKDMSDAVNLNVRNALLTRDNAHNAFEFGVRNVHPGLGMDELAKQALASHTVRILIPWFEDQGPWKEGLPIFLADHRNDFTIFIAGEDAAWTKSRGLILESDPNYGSERVRTTMALLKRSLARKPNAHLFQMQSCMPSLLIVEHDGYAVVGFYLNSGHSTRNPQIDVQTATTDGKRTAFGKMIDQEFAKLQQCSQAIDLSR